MEQEKTLLCKQPSSDMHRTCIVQMRTCGEASAHARVTHPGRALSTFTIDLVRQSPRP